MEKREHPLSNSPFTRGRSEYSGDPLSISPFTRGRSEAKGEKRSEEN